MTALTILLNSAIAGTSPQTTARRKALSLVKWRLRSGLLYAGVDSAFKAVLVGPDDAMTFDGRDNEQAKLAYWQAMTGRTFEIEIL